MLHGAGIWTPAFTRYWWPSFAGKYTSMEHMDYHGISWVPQNLAFLEFYNGKQRTRNCCVEFPCWVNFGCPGGSQLVAYIVISHDKFEEMPTHRDADLLINCDWNFQKLQKRKCLPIQTCSVLFLPKLSCRSTCRSTCHGHGLPLREVGVLEASVRPRSWWRSLRNSPVQVGTGRCASRYKDEASWVVNLMLR